MQAYIYVYIYYIVYDVVYDIVYDIVYDEFFEVDISFQFLQIHLINKAIQTAKQGSPLYKLPLITDPSEKIVETQVAALKWHPRRCLGPSAGMDVVRVSYNSSGVALASDQAGRVDWCQSFGRTADSRQD